MAGALLHRAGCFNSSGAAPATDPHWANVVFLSGFDAGTGDSPFTEESANARTVTSNGVGATTVLTSPKFGTGACYSFNTGGDYWYLADNADWHFGSGNFTIETWVRFVTAPTTGIHYLFGQYNTGTGQRSWALAVDNGRLNLKLSNDGATQINKLLDNWAPSTATWYHVAADFDGTNYRTYVDGVMLGKTGTPVTLHNSTALLSITSATNTGDARNGSFEGRLDELRITKGVARYASDSGFAVPTAAYPRS